MKVDDEERQATRDLIGGLNLALRNVRAERDELRAEVRRLSAKLDAVPVAAMGEVMDAFENEGFPFGYKRQRDAITSWLDAQVQP